MAYSSHRPHFTVTVTSGFLAESRWGVHAVVEYRTLGLDGIRKEIEAEARLELMIGIARESRAGRERDAESVVVLVEGDHEVGEFFSRYRQSA